MRILILNWRDVRNPRGGGAERVTHELARRLVERGHGVTWLSAHTPGAPGEEEIDGVTIVRRGNELTTHAYGPSVAKRGFDVVVDAINTIPYLAPLWARAPVVALVHQLARDVWWYEAQAPVALVGWAVEPIYLQAYRHVPIVTVSLSTRDDLRRLGLRGTIDVLQLAVTSPPTNDPAEKALNGRLVAIGRLTPSKRFDHAVRALAILKRSFPDARLDIVGVGGEQRRIEDEAARLGVAPAVHLHGGISDSERDRLLANADVLVGTSVREGWGLIVTEAALAATPAVVYDIPGFRDSVVDGRTGIVTAPEPEALANAIAGLLRDANQYAQLALAAQRRAARATWDDCANAFESTLVAAVSAAGG